jgi:UDP-glucose 4-epimerase
VQWLTGKEVTFYEADIRDTAKMEGIFKAHKFDAVIHFAAFKAVGESVRLPLKYYDNNISGTVELLRIMDKYDVKKIIFSSSATVYGDPERLPVDESCRLSTTNPYGATKLMMEMIMQDVSKADREWNIVLLRYFNPVGAHESGLIGEDPKGIPNNLFPYITQVAVGKREKLGVFGNDYNTHDGTGVRDFIHVVDLAKGHVLAVNKLAENPGLIIVNLGTGQGYSVLDMVKAFEKTTGKPIPYKIMPRRPGDIDECYADPTLAKEVLGFKAEKTLDDMCRDAMNWQTKNPNGYDE